VNCVIRTIANTKTDSASPVRKQMGRLWTIANNTCPPTNGAEEAVAGRSKSQRVAMFAKLPIAALR